MTLIRHDPATVNRPVGNYSHAVEVPAGAGTLYISGQADTNSRVRRRRLGDARPALTV